MTPALNTCGGNSGGQLTLSSNSIATITAACPVICAPVVLLGNSVGAASITPKRSLLGCTRSCNGCQTGSLGLSCKPLIPRRQRHSHNKLQAKRGTIP